MSLSFTSVDDARNNLIKLGFKATHNVPEKPNTFVETIAVNDVVFHIRTKHGDVFMWVFNRITGRFKKLIS